MNSLQNMNINRWPPIYDFEELGQQINKLLHSCLVRYLARDDGRND